ncbi:MAG: GTP-binding protein YchF [Candidatus Saganbacteria bacterium]|uniref:Ribosome-binding ATPase YchF n=1 Tax=Candidatus Saganbacteria bacterium TaxID=2575572 RepID=A0A833KZK2_UNCSA|nr:MAG: GTP-binding protein YchF [Candidatus Saganbacteria bacterium]
MSFSIGIVGLPNVGKSTLFNALSRAKAEVQNYPFCTIDPNVGVVTVPDERLNKLRDLFVSKKFVPTIIEFYDIAGLVKGAHKGEGLGNQFLSHIRDVDAIAHVVRCFSAEDIIHVEGKVDPAKDIELIEAELILADLSLIDKRFDSIRKAVKSGDKNILKTLHILEKLKLVLDQGKTARVILPSMNSEDIKLLKEFPLLTLKPVIYVANVDESGNPDKVGIIEKIAKEQGARVITISSKMEAEIAELPPEEGKLFISELGLKESALNRLIMASYELLELITFFTVGEKEAHAWTIKKGINIQQAAGKIHSDMEKGFIAGEVISYEEMLSCTTYAKAKEKGVLRIEGRGYVVHDGDILVIRFNV